MYGSIPSSDNLLHSIIPYQHNSYGCIVASHLATTCYIPSFHINIILTDVEWYPLWRKMCYFPCIFILILMCSRHYESSLILVFALSHTHLSLILPRCLELSITCHLDPYIYHCSIQSKDAYTWLM